MGLLDCIKKDRAKLIAIFLIPIIALPVLTYFFSGIFVEHIKFGVVNLDDSQLSRTIVKGLKDHPGIDIVYYGDSEAQLQQQITTKKITGGIIIPEHFGADVREKRAPKALVVMDSTNLLISNNLMSYVGTVMATYNAGAQISVLEGKNMLPDMAKKTVTSFTLIDRTLYDSKLSYMTYMMYVLTLLLLQMFYLNFFYMPLLMEEKDYFRGRKIKWPELWERMGPMANRMMMMMLTITTGSFTGLVLSFKLFGLPMRGNVLAYFVLMFLFFISLSIMGLVITLFVTRENFLSYLEFYYIINLLFFFTSGTVWPEYMIPAGFMPVVRALWPFVYFANPLKFLNLKGIGWPIINGYIHQALIFCAGWGLIVLVLYTARNWIIRDEPIANKKNQAA